jgi:hypothetical protein
VLRDVLSDQLVSDPDLLQELKALLASAGPTVRVVQRMNEASDVVGLESSSMMEGTATVEQKITKARGVKGAVFDTLGAKK